MPGLFQRTTHHWQGQLGQWFDAQVYGLGEDLNFGAVVYIIGRARPDGYYDPLYCGQSGDGDERLTSRHEKMAPAIKMGATHVHIIPVADRARRFAVETDLRRRHTPPLNTQSMPAPAASALTYADLMGGLSGFSPSPLGGLFALGGSGMAAAMTPPPKNNLRGLGALSRSPLAPPPASNALAGVLSGMVPLTPPPTNSLFDLGALSSLEDALSTDYLSPLSPGYFGRR